MVIASVLAQNGNQGGGAGSLLIFLPLILVFYFFMIRPQRNRMRQHAALIRSLEIGDEVETTGGIFGTIRRLDEDSLWLEIAAGTTVRISRGAVRRKVVEEEEPSGSAP